MPFRFKRSRLFAALPLSLAAWLGCSPDTTGALPGDARPEIRGFALLSAEPTTWPTSGGGILRLHGRGFLPDSHVQIAGVDAPLIAQPTDTLLQVRLPPRLGTPGPAEIVVKLPSGERLSRTELFHYSASEVRFSGPTAYIIQDPPIDIAVSDLNGDSFPDLLIATNPRGRLYTMLGSQRGLFAVQYRFPVCLNARGLTLAQLDGDPHLDAAVVCEDELRVFHGRGDGTFEPGLSHPHVDANCNSVLSADLDEDGNQDVAFACMKSGTIQILWGKGDRSFKEEELTGLPSACSIQIADFDRDGRKDLAIARCGSGQNRISVLHRDPARPRGFVRKDLEVKGVSSLAELATGDLDQDGVPDLVLVDPDDGKLHILQLSASEQPASMRSFPGLAVYTDGNGIPFIGDVDQDGRPDVLMGGNRALSLFTPTGSGFGFMAQQLSINDEGCRRIIDFNRDGIPDLVTCSSDTVNVALGLGRGQFDLPEQSEIATSSDDRTVFADINQDGQIDFSSARHSPMSRSNNKTLYFETSRKGNRLFERTRVTIPDWIDDYALVNLDLDGAPDLITASTDSSQVRLYRNVTPSGEGPSFDFIQKFTFGRSPRSLLTANLDTLAPSDLVVATVDGFLCSVLLTRTGENIAPGAARCVAAPLHVFELIAEDMDADGKTDVVGFSAVSGMIIWWGDGQGGLSDFVPVSTEPTSLGRLAELNRDRLPDALFLSSAGISSVLNLGQRKWSAPRAHSVSPWEPQGIAVLDANGDGLDDFLLRDRIEAQLALFLNGGRGESWSQVPIPVGTVAPENFYITDLDHDGRVDILATSGDPASIFYLLNRSR